MDSVGLENYHSSYPGFLFCKEIDSKLEREVDVIEILDRGEVISFPTETVYALACDATNDEAVKKIYELKKREYSKPLSVFFKNIEEAKKYLIFNKKAEILAKKFMPGEITLVLNRKKGANLSKFVNSKDNTLGFRIPNHKLCLDLLNTYGKPIVATSANTAGNPASTDCRDVEKYFGDSVYVVKSNNEESSRQPSTIVDLSGDEVKFIREGAVGFGEVEKCLHL